MKHTSIRGFRAHWTRVNKRSPASISWHGPDVATVTNIPKSQWFNTTRLYFSYSISTGLPGLSTPHSHSGTQDIGDPTCLLLHLLECEAASLATTGKDREACSSLKSFCPEVTYIISSLNKVAWSKEPGKCGLPCAEERQPGIGEHQPRLPPSHVT